MSVIPPELSASMLLNNVRSAGSEKFDSGLIIFTVFLNTANEMAPSSSASAAPLSTARFLKSSAPNASGMPTGRTSIMMKATTSMNLYVAPLQSMLVSYT